MPKDYTKTEEQASQSPPAPWQASDMGKLLTTLDKVFSTFREQLRDEAPRPFTGNAKIAVDAFNDILARLRFETRPQAFKITGKALSLTEIELSWTDVAGNADGYRVERCEGYNCSDLHEVGRLASTERSYKDFNLSSNTLYRYQVVAFNFRGETPSNVFDVTTLSTYPAKK